MKKTILSLILMATLTNKALAEDLFSASDETNLEMLNELVAQKCNIDFEEVYQLHDDNRGEEVENFFGLADSITYALEGEYKALLIQIKTATNDTRDHGVQIESINDIEINEDTGLLIELENNGPGTSLIACLKGDEYNIRARQILTGGGRLGE